MNDTVIVAVNGGAGSDAALAWALDWTALTGQPLTVCTIIDTDLFESDAFAPTREQVLRRAMADVERFAPHARPTYQIHRGRPSEALVEMSESAAMIVIGAHKTDPLTGLFHGTLPLRIADRASCPVVVVPSGWRSHGGPVLVGVDYETDDEAIEFATRAAELLSASLEVVHAWVTPSYAAGDYFTWFEYSEEITDANWNVLHSIVEPIRERHPKLAIESTVTEGRPVDVLSRRAAGARCVVVGTHHRAAFAGMMLGSVGHDLLIGLPCPVAIVPTTTRRNAWKGVAEREHDHAV